MRGRRTVAGERAGRGAVQTVPAGCATCSFWSGRPSDYLGPCSHPNVLQGRTAFDAWCPEWTYGRDADDGALIVPRRLVVGVSLNWHFFEIFLDGEFLPDCVEADSHEGWARCLVRDAEGHYIVEPGHMQVYQTEVRRGRVEFRLRAD